MEQKMVSHSLMRYNSARLNSNNKNAVCYEN